MNTSTIEHYVYQQNEWARLLGESSLSLLNTADRQHIMDRLESDLSPENLTCDGELGPKDVAPRYNWLMRAKQELLSIDPELEHYIY